MYINNIFILSIRNFFSWYLNHNTVKFDLSLKIVSLYQIFLWHKYLNNTLKFNLSHAGSQRKLKLCLAIVIAHLKID